VRAVNHPHLGCLVDSYHFWQENEPLENVAAAVPRILHVHVADQAGRVPPGESGSGDYRPLFHALKAGGYDGNISVEADFPQALIREKGAAVLNYLKTQWLEA
jgi:sugar phosphate isomerase/epimerase